MPEPVNRTAIFDPGTFSEAALDIDKLEYLDDIIVTHQHQDHMSIPLIRQLVGKFPGVRVTAPKDAAAILNAEGIKASSEAGHGIEFFKSPHEKLRPMMEADPPDQLGVHYLDLLSNPGDGHSFKETKAILALPIQAPWGSTRHAIELALKLRPRFILPIHDWHWSDQARQSSYDNYEKLFAKHGIKFYKLKTGQPVVIEV
jgi:L-ascorbate metabolism protein UlaG (beta-lactamase superfamily)